MPPGPRVTISAMARPRIDPEHPDSPARAIAAAMAMLLRRRGYHGAGLNEVVAGSGAPRGSVYHHYPQGKDAIGAAAVRMVGSGVVHALGGGATRAAGRTPRAALGVIAAQLSGWLQRSGFDEGCPVVGAALALGPDTPLTREACAEAFAGWVDALAEVYRDGGIDASRAAPLARLSISALEGAVALCRAQRSIEPMQEVSAELGALLDAASTGTKSTVTAQAGTASAGGASTGTAPTAAAPRRVRRAGR
ncbi:MAG: TetR/AcrR family transcriptional regulator [Burkholderiales bacterium]|nr:MAG: TetR/AcrR family transcriptional regulator [Burkholderiales bacterium]